MSKAAGARSVAAIDTNARRLETARQFGADDTVQALPSDTPRRDVDIVFELSGASTAMETTLDWLAIGGTAVWVGATFPQQPLRIDAEQIVRRLLIIKGLHNYNQHDLLTAAAFVEKHHATYPFNQLIHDGFDLSHVNEAFAYALESNAYRVGVRISQ
jgi:alcohol dehydrogenase